MHISNIQTRSIISRSKLSDFAVNPYVGCSHACKYCYASFMGKYANHADEQWGTYVDIKHWNPVAKPEKYAGRSLFVGSVTDPYQPVEAEHGRTRVFLEQMRGSGARIQITTKSDLILRDLELIRSIPDISVTWSINTLNEGFRREMDCAVPIQKRLDAMQAFHETGVSTQCFIAPVFPGITGVPSIILAARDRCDRILIDKLNLRGGNRQTVFTYIRERHPELLPLYFATYEKHDQSYWESLDRQISSFAAAEGLSYALADHPEAERAQIVSFIRT